jgi:hypothetical protein
MACPKVGDVVRIVDPKDTSLTYIYEIKDSSTALGAITLVLIKTERSKDEVLQT